MDKVSILKVRDKDEDQEALAIVRSVNGFIALTLSLEHNGDVQVAFTPSECLELISRLQQGVFDAKDDLQFAGEIESKISDRELVVGGMSDVRG